MKDKVKYTKNLKENLESFLSGNNINEANSDLQSLMDEFGVKPNMGGIGNGYEYNGMVFDNPKGAILSAMFDELKELEGTGKYNVADSFFKRIQLLRKII